VNKKETIKLVWITPQAEETIAYCARVSNPKAQINDDYSKLLSYLIKHRHWSPFEMASACIEIITTRDIARQILRHRSFSFQEFSQRYATTDKLEDASFREARLQDEKNKQNSIKTNDELLKSQWNNKQKEIMEHCKSAYSWAINNGVAREQARAVLPEGLTLSRLMMSGTIRSWLHYCMVRTTAGTQAEHREIANNISKIMEQNLNFWKNAMENLKKEIQ
jgi:thymidylate synthase (FAD)